jgi:20S proteasome alpha/beta subunit
MFVINIQNMLQAGMIVGGWDKYEGGQIFSVPLGGTILKQPFAIGGIILPIKLYCSLLSSQYFNATSIILFAVTYFLCYG